MLLEVEVRKGRRVGSCRHLSWRVVMRDDGMGYRGCQKLDSVLLTQS